MHISNTCGMQADIAEKLAIGVGGGAYKAARYKAEPSTSPLSSVCMGSALRTELWGSCCRG